MSPLFALISIAVVTQGDQLPPDAPYWHYERLAHEGKYMETLRFCESKEKWSDDNSRQQFLARIQAALGLYGASEETYLAAMAPWLRSDFTAAELNAAKTVKLTDASTEILKAARNRQVLCISEAHFMPWNRAFGTSLLPGLYKEGFRYLCLETRDAPALAAMSANRLVRFSSERFGYDPVRATMLDEAMRMKYKLVAIDSTEQLEDRERYMAEQVQAVLKAEPKAKVLVWAGYSHVTKIRQDGYTPPVHMAKYLWDATGIEPFSVWQCAWDGSDVTGVNAMLDKAGRNSQTPVAILPSAGDPFSGTADKLGVDLLIAYPRSKGDAVVRPSWWTQGKSLIRGLACGVGRRLVQAIRAGAVPDVVPVDQVLVSGKGRYTLALARGSYDIRIVDEGDRVVDSKKVVVR